MLLTASTEMQPSAADRRAVEALSNFTPFDLFIECRINEDLANEADLSDYHLPAFLRVRVDGAFLDQLLCTFDDSTTGCPGRLTRDPESIDERGRAEALEEIGEWDLYMSFRRMFRFVGCTWEKPLVASLSMPFDTLLSLVRERVVAASAVASQVPPSIPTAPPAAAISHFLGAVMYAEPKSHEELIRAATAAHPELRAARLASDMASRIAGAGEVAPVAAAGRRRNRI